MWFAAFSMNKKYCNFGEDKLQGNFIVIRGDIWYNFRVVDSYKNLANGDCLMNELIAKLGCTKTYDKENVLIDIFIYLLENKIELTDGLLVFMELSKLRDRTLSDGSESYFEEYEYAEIFMQALKIWSNDEIVKIYDDLYKAKAYDKINTWVSDNEWQINDLLSAIIKECFA